jgi:hypothetical protein
MGIDPELRDMFPHEVAVTAGRGLDGIYGHQTGGTTKTYRAQVVWQNKLVRNAQGEQVVSACQVILYGVSGVTVEDAITLPDGTSPAIISVERFPDDSGDYVERVAC